MKRNGFTLLELLAVLIVLSFLLVLTVPAYTEIYSRIRRENYNSKLTQIEAAAKKYGDTIKDEVKNGTNKCITTNIDTLIKRGYLMSEADKKNAIYDPTTGEEMTNPIYICYSTVDYDIVVFYTKLYDEKKYFYKNEVVRYNNSMFLRCQTDYLPSYKDDRDNPLKTSSDTLGLKTIYRCGYDSKGRIDCSKKEVLFERIDY